MYTQDFARLWAKLTKDYQTHMESKLSPSLTEAQLSVLELLEERKKMKPSDLIPYLATTPAAVTMLLDRMEKAGLITRERDLEDRRIVWISITDKGREETNRGLQIRNDFLTTVLNQISSHNQQLLIFLLGKITSVDPSALNKERA